MAGSYIAVSELRFRENLGKRTLKNGTTVRCQAVAKGQLRKIRLERNDPDLLAEDVWPLGQCHHPAIAGSFLCGKHGGLSNNIQKKLITDYMPLDLAAKVEALRDDAELLNRSSEMARLKARNAQLDEMLDELVLSDESYDLVSQAKRVLGAGDILKASFLLEAILQNPRSETSIWAEIRENLKLYDKLATDQFSMVQTMKILATTDQVTSLMELTFRVVNMALDKHVKDKAIVNTILTEVADEMTRASNSLLSRELVSGK